MGSDYASWIGEYWPWMVGAAIIVLGHAWLYGVRDEAWTPLNPALIAAVVVVLAIELVRGYLSDDGNRRNR